ncbi:hypothetical protein [Streptomyces sp. NPDC002851]
MPAATSVGSAPPNVTSEVLWAAARQAEVALERCELTDTALVRLLAAYQDVTNAYV